MNRHVTRNKNENTVYKFGYNCRRGWETEFFIEQSTGNKNVIEHLNKEKLEINKCYLVNTKVDNGHVIKLKLLELYDNEAIFTRVERDKY